MCLQSISDPIGKIVTSIPHLARLFVFARRSKLSTFAGGFKQGAKYASFHRLFSSLCFILLGRGTLELRIKDKDLKKRPEEKIIID